MLVVPSDVILITVRSGNRALADARPKHEDIFFFKNAQSQKLSILLADCRAVVFCKRNHSISKEICKTSNENKIPQITEKFQINSKTSVAS